MNKEKEIKYSIKELRKVYLWLYEEGACVYPYNFAEDFIGWLEENAKVVKIVLEEK